MGAAVAACLLDESLRTSVDILRILETRRMAMHPQDYLEAAGYVAERMAEIDLDGLVSIARSRQPVLAEAAESELFARGAEARIDASMARRTAIREAERLIQRL